MSTFATMLKAAESAGREKVRRERACADSGGHYKDHESNCNGKPAWRCRCGYRAIKTASIWVGK